MSATASDLAMAEKPGTSDTAVPSKASSITDLEKRDLDSGDTDEEKVVVETEVENAGNSTESDSDEYPKGATLAFIVLALALSIFLVSLDMVSLFSLPSFASYSGFSMRFLDKLTANPRRPLSPQLFPRSPMSFTACKMWLGTDLPSS